MVYRPPTVAELAHLQRKAHDARRALKAAQSETRAALQLVAQLDDELAELTPKPTAQPEEAQHGRNPQEALARA